MNENYLTPRPHPSACDETLWTSVYNVLDGRKIDQKFQIMSPFQITS